MKKSRVLCLLLAFALALSCFAGCDVDSSDAKAEECPSCGAENEENAKFCAECGEKLPKAVCPSCEKENSLTAKFCSTCGSSLKTEDAPDDDAQGDNTQGDNSQGDNSQGDNSQGDNSQGDNSQGDNTQGDNTQGDNTQGDNTQGDNTQGDNSQGDNSQGDNAQGDNTQGDNTQGDNTQGDNTQGDNTQGDNTQGDNTQGDNTQGDNTQGDVLPEKTTIRIAVSAAQNPDATFPAADIYTRGPDGGRTDSVQKAVLARNQKVADLLNADVEYVLTNLSYDQVLGDVEHYVRGASEDAPDIYNNDIYGLLRAMMAGYLYNVNDPGVDASDELIESRFDFTHESWYYDFMKGLTVDHEKIYLLAGDYFLDILRMTWVIYVNADMFNANASALDYEDINEFYECVKIGIWDITYMTYLAHRIWKDDGKIKGKADYYDSCIGLAINHFSDKLFINASGVTPIYQDESGMPCLMKDTFDYESMASKLRLIQTGISEKGVAPETGSGILYDFEPISSVSYFMSGGVLFAPSFLGEFESPAMRGVDFQKGVVPLPKWNEMRQEEYRSVVHDTAEVGAVLKNTHSFESASAFMQLASEESADVFNEYFEKGLKFKYTDSKSVRDMIDLIYATMEPAFDLYFTPLLELPLSHGEDLYAAAVSETVNSSFFSLQRTYEAQIDLLISKFDRIP